MSSSGLHPLLAGGTHQHQDPAAVKAHLAALRRSVSTAQATLDQWTGFQTDYKSLKATLTELPARVSHQVMVPLGPLAFMPGKLVHTNEVTVLLGDNWFVERSAAQAAEIVQRRMDFVAEKLTDAQSTFASLESKLASVDPTLPPAPTDHPDQLPELNEEGLPFMDIREDVDNPTIPDKSTPLPRSPVSPAPAPAAGKKASKKSSKKQQAAGKSKPAEDPLAHARQVVAQFAKTGKVPVSAEGRAALDAMFGGLSLDNDDDDADEESARMPAQIPATAAVQSTVIERTPPPAITTSPATPLPVDSQDVPRKSSLKKSPSISSLDANAARHVRWAMDDATTEDDSSACPTPTSTAFTRTPVFTSGSSSGSAFDQEPDDNEFDDDDDDFDDDSDNVKVLVRPGKPAPSSAPASTAQPPMSKFAWAAAAAKRTSERAASTAATLPAHPPSPHAKKKQSRKTNVPVRDSIIERVAPASPTDSCPTDIEPSPPAPHPVDPSATPADDDNVDDYTHLREIASAYHASRQHLVHQMLSRSHLTAADLADAGAKQFDLSPVDVARAELAAEFGSGPGFDPLMEMVVRKEVREGDGEDEGGEDEQEEEGVGERLPIVDDVNGEIHLPVRGPWGEGQGGDREAEVGPVRVRLVERDADKTEAKPKPVATAVGHVVREAGVSGSAPPAVVVQEEQPLSLPAKRVSKFKQARMAKQ